MKNLASRLALASALALAVSAGSALAGNGPGPGAGMGQGQGVRARLRCLSILDLTEQQKADIKKVVEDAKPELQRLGEKLRTDAKALRDAVEATPADPCAVGTAALAVHGDRVAIRAEVEKVRTGIAAVLTPEQKAKFEGCMQALKGPAATGNLLDDGDDTEID